MRYQDPVKLWRRKANKRLFLGITFDWNEIETWGRCQSVRLVKTHRMLCNMSYLSKSVTLTLDDPRSKLIFFLQNSDFRGKKYISRSALTRETRLWQNHCSIFYINLVRILWLDSISNSVEVIDEKLCPREVKWYFFMLTWSGRLTIDLNR